jgi:hypothetical protein
MASFMTSESLARRLAQEIEAFLAEAPQAAMIEDGSVIFDLSSSKFSIKEEFGKCVLHLWSEERNVVRRVLDCERKRGVLRLSVQKFGAARSHVLEICADRDRRSAAAKRTTRSVFQRQLERTLLREFPGWHIGKLSNATDLERSFGPAFIRGMRKKGRSAFALVGVATEENQSTIDAALTTALLWLDHLREREAARVAIEGVKLFLPAGRIDLVRARIAHLNHGLAKFHLYEFDEKAESLSEIDSADSGNVATRLVRAPDERAALERFRGAITRIASVVPEAEAVVLSSTEVAFRLHGLEFACARIAVTPGSFQRAEEIVFGAGPYETVLTDENAEHFHSLLTRVREIRRPLGDRAHALWRMQPERWMESLILRDIHAFDQRLDPAHVYSQVPAFAAGDRAMIDVLAATHEGRLAVLELKADEDMHLPLQGLDYWARVQWHQSRGEFQQFGYFPGRQLSTKSPLLLLVAPALHVHPTTDRLLRYLSPRIEWELIGVDESWRSDLRVIFRKHCPRTNPATHA